MKSVSLIRPHDKVSTSLRLTPIHWFLSQPDVQINLIVPVEEYLAEMDDPSIVYVVSHPC